MPLVPPGPLAFAVLVALAGPLHQQTAGTHARRACPSTASSAAGVLRDADSNKTAGGDADELVACYDRAADEARAGGDALTEARARLSSALVQFERGRYTNVRPDVMHARDLAVALGDVVLTARADRLLGALAQMTGDRDLARRSYEEALKGFGGPGVERDRARTLLDLASVSAPADGDRLRNEAMSLAERIGASDLYGEALHARADREYQQGHFDEAGRDLSLAIDRIKSAHPTDLGALGNAYVSMGRLLRAHGRPADALQYYDRAIAVLKKADDLRGLAQAVNAKAVALGRLHRAHDALAAYKDALHYAEQTGSPRIIRFAKGNLASAYGAVGDYGRSVRLMQEVLADETDPYLLAYRHAALAGNYVDMKKPALAASHISEAIRFARESHNTDLLPMLLAQEARIDHSLGRDEPALDAAMSAVSALEDLRRRLVPLDFMKRGFANMTEDVYDFSVSLLSGRGEAARALEISEAARARAFLDLLASRNATVPAGAAALQPLAAADHASTEAAPTIDTAEAVDTARALRATILSYWVSADATYVWVTPAAGTIHETRVRVPRSTLEKLVSESLSGPARSADRAFRRLHALLIEPVLPWLPPRDSAIVIVPHGALARVSFAALRDARGHYLIERYAITYAPSISTLWQAHAHAGAPAPADGYVLVADPAPLPVRQPPLPPLPGSRREVDLIKSVLGTAGSALTGRSAAETAIRARAPSAHVLHMATHGVIKDDAPFDSFLAVGAGGTAADADGRLTVSELYDLKLSADLVVLSGCRTATGPLSGDGITGLSRALFYAGTSSVMATLWSVADEPSATLMAAFYKYWRRGLEKREALRRAQLDLLHALRAGSVRVTAPNGVVPLQERPFYWAGFVLIGQP